MMKIRKKFADKIRYANVDNFTSDFGLMVRRKIYKVFGLIFKFAVKGIYRNKVIIDKELKLDKNKNYIFVANHSFCIDSLVIGSTIDRNCYVLFGGTDLLYSDIRSFLGWFSGMIYVDRTNKQSKIDSVAKMNRVLKAGNSMLLFPEGRLNDDESKLCLKIFSGVYNLSLENEIEVVPISVFNESLSRDIHISYGEPLKLYEYDKDKGLQILRDNLATMLYEQIDNYSTPFERGKVEGDMHINYMDERMDVYSKTTWRSDYCWDDELFEYKAGDVDLEDVWKDIDKVNINVKNAHIFGDILVELERRKKYNFKDYMNENYRKKY